MVVKFSLFLASLYTLAITVLSLVRLGKISVGSFNPTDKMLHAGAYFGMAVLWMLYFIFKDNFKNFKANLLKVAIYCSLFGILIEVLQGVLTDFREPDWLDALANSSGVLLAAILYLVFRKNLERLKNRISLDI